MVTPQNIAKLNKKNRRYVTKPKRTRTRCAEPEVIRIQSKNFA